MIVDGILFIVKSVLNILLSPLELVNIVVDLSSSIPVVGSFLSIIAFVLPWKNILPLVVITCGILSFKAAISILRFFK